MLASTSIQLRPESDIPLYRQLAEDIEQRIRSGIIRVGDRLPPTRELAEQLGLNRATVSAAYAVLEQSGLLQGHVGRGSFVARRAEAAAASSLDWESLFPAVESASSAAVRPAASSGGLISFATSRPAEASFPLDAFRRLCKEVVDGREAADILQLGSPYGYAPLRQHLLSEARTQGLAREGDDLLVTNGCQQALDLLARLFGAGDGGILLEDPAYHGLLRVFDRANITPVPMLPGGLDMDALERAAVQGRARVFIVTPNFQNPTGHTLSLETRQRILEMAGRHRIVVVESNVYGDLRYRGQVLPSLKQLAGGADVIYLGSYSKVAFPGLRVGWVIGPRVLVARLAEAKQACDLHSDQLSQAVLLRFAESGELARHLEETKRAGRARLEAVLESCERWLPQGAEFTRPDGGMNLWVKLPPGLRADALLLRAEEQGVSFLPGSYFSPRQAHPNGLRLSFGGLQPEEIRRGVQILGEAMRELLTRQAAPRLVEPVAALV